MKEILQRAQPIFLLLALLFIFGLLRSQWSELRIYRWHLHVGWLTLSLLFLLASWAMEVAIWRQLLHLLGGRIPYWPAVRIWFLSAIVRYIPGNIWQPLSMTLRCQQWGVQPEAAVASVAFYQVVILLAVVPISSFYFLTYQNFGLLTNFLNQYTYILVGLAGMPVLVFLLRPQWLIVMMNWLLHKAGRPPLQTEMSSARLLQLLVLAAINWGFWGLSFATLTFALGEYAQTDITALSPHLIAAYPIAYAVGFMSFITPSGFGVREGAFYLLLVPLLDGGIVTIAALASRIVTTLGELVMAALSALVEWRGANRAIVPQ